MDAVTLRTDVDAIPTDGTAVLVGTLNGEVFISRFIPGNKFHPNGRWQNMASDSWPIAWAPVPDHPYFPGNTKPLVSPQ